MELLDLGAAVAGLSTAVAGLGLLIRRAAVLSGVLLVLTGLTAVTGALLLASGSQQAGGDLVTVAGAVLGPVALATFPRARWRHPVDVVAISIVVGCGLIVTAFGGPEVALTWGIVGASAFLAHTWWRIEVTTGRERREVTWMTLALTLALLVGFFAAFSAEGVEDQTLPALAIASFAGVGPALFVGATLPDLVDVRGLVVSSVVSIVAVVTVMSVFVLELALLDALGAGEINTGALALLAACAAVAFHPTRVVLRGVVDQLLFGERPDPLGAASAVAGRIGADPATALRAVREALVIPYAALRQQGRLVAESGTETTHTRTLDLDGSGELVVGLRPGDLSFSSGDEQVLRLTVPLLTQTLRARALAEDLLESRGQTIAAVEEERRRLRRELHDGLGPRLSGVAFTSDAARNLIRTDPDAAEEMVARLRADTVTAIEEIRRLVYGMRPPALDELGLVPALRQHAVGLRNRTGDPVAVEVVAPATVSDLPAAVEVAAYRIVAEALTNVARHSTSATASVRLQRTARSLDVEITDHGHSDAWRRGVGLTSMVERATELGGTLEAGPGPGGGRVVASLPLPNVLPGGGVPPVPQGL